MYQQNCNLFISVKYILIKTTSYNTDHFVNSVESYFNFALSVDCVIFGFDNNELKVLLIRSKMDPFVGKWSVIGDMITVEEDLDIAAQRILNYRTGMKNVFLKQAKTFGSPYRHPLGRVVTIAYYALIKIEDFQLQTEEIQNEAHWHKLSEVPSLAFDHNSILDFSLKILRKQVREKPIGFELLPEKFTLGQLQILYESILGQDIDKRNFRKKILKMKILIDHEELQQNVAHRPAKLFSFDRERYLELKKKGWVFDL